MKFIWNEPERDHRKEYHNLPKMWWEKPLIGWLNYNRVWPDESRDYWSCHYNYVYHFFDIHIFECWLPCRGAPDDVIKAMRSYLSGSGLDWEERSTYRWDDHKQRPGVRFWIQAEDHPRCVRACKKCDRGQYK